MRSLVTITCNRDRWTFEKQFKSAEKCIKDCHWIIIPNDQSNEKWLEWFEGWARSLKPNFTYEIISAQDIFQKYLNYKTANLLIENLYGYNRQSLLKLIIANHVRTEEYVCIDSKIWFVRPLDVNLIPYQERDRYTVDIPTINEIEKLWGIRPKLITNQITPYVMNRQIVIEMLDDVGGTREYADFFCEGVLSNRWCENNNKMQNLAEFYIIDGYCQAKNLLNNVFRQNPWLHSSQSHFYLFDKNTILNKIKDRNLQILSVWWHANKITDTDKEEIWLAVKNGLDENLV